MRLELTRRGDYAVRVMIDLARDTTGTCVSAGRIAARMGIPAQFVGQVMRDLVAGGLVHATVGRRGGYRLARPAAEISLLEVIEAVEGDARRRTCVLRSVGCGTDGFCDVHAVFSAAQEAMLAQLAAATLAQIAAGHPAVLVAAAG